VKAKGFLGACFVLFGGLLVWPLLTAANKPVLIAAIVLVLFLARPRSGDEDSP